MPKRSSKPKGKPKDVNQIAANILKAVTREAKDQPGKNPAAVALGRLGGLKGGKARARSLTPEERKEIAKNAAAARWTAKAEK